MTFKTTLEKQTNLPNYKRNSMFGIIVVSIIVSVLTFLCIFFCGAWWHTQLNGGDGLFEGDAVWLFIITAICIGMTIMCWTVTGRARVKTRTLPVIERKVTLTEKEEEIKSDTLYIFKFRE